MSNAKEIKIEVNQSASIGARLGIKQGIQHFIVPGKLSEIDGAIMIDEGTIAKPIVAHCYCMIYKEWTTFQCNTHEMLRIIRWMKGEISADDTQLSNALREQCMTGMDDKLWDRYSNEQIGDDNVPEVS